MSDEEVLAAIAALADEWAEHSTDVHRGHASRLRAVLAEHSTTLANVRADAWDEGWSERATYDPSGWDEPLAPNPYRNPPTP